METVPTDWAAKAAELDLMDPLAGFRSRFVVADKSLIYMDGNSLGRLPKAAAEAAKRTIDFGWGDRLVRGWPEGWVERPTRIGAKIAQLIGSRDDEVIVADSTSVNLFKLAIAALTAKAERSVIVSDDLNFPSDLYVLQGCARLLGKALKTVESEDGVHPPTERILSAISPDTALVSLTHTAFKSGALFDMQRITSAAHDAGALMLWDLSHSAGAVPLDLNACGVDLAIGCTYKYLNGGPGSPAFLYVRKDLQNDLLSPIWGWFGERRPFDFRLDYEPADGIARFFAGTPPIVSMTAIEAGVDLLLEAGVDAIRRKSIAQTELLIQMFDERLAPLGFQLRSPRDANTRGSHVSISHPDAWRIDQALIEEMNVIPDFRAPDNIRFGVTPLYTTFDEIVQAVDLTARTVEQKLYERFSGEALSVT